MYYSYLFTKKRTHVSHKFLWIWIFLKNKIHWFYTWLLIYKCLHQSLKECNRQLHKITGLVWTGFFHRAEESETETFKMISGSPQSQSTPTDFISLTRHLFPAHVPRSHWQNLEYLSMLWGWACRHLDLGWWIQRSSSQGRWHLMGCPLSYCTTPPEEMKLSMHYMEKYTVFHIVGMLETWLIKEWEWDH